MTPEEIAWEEERLRLEQRVAEAKQAEAAWANAHARFSDELAAAQERIASWERELAAHLEAKP